MKWDSVIGCSDLKGTNSGTNGVQDTVKIDDIREKVSEFLDLPNVKTMIYLQDQHGDTLLHYLLSQGTDLQDEVLRIVEMTSDVSSLNIVNKNGYSVLHLAASARATAIIEALIRKGAHSSLQSNTGVTPLWLACMNNDLDSVHALLFKAENMVDNSTPTNNGVNFYNNKGITCLHVAALFNNEELANELLLHGANVEARVGRSGHTALRIAMDRKFRSMAIFLMEKWQASMKNAMGTQPNIQPEEKPSTPTLKAISLFKQDHEGETQLHIAVAGGCIGSVRKIIDYAQHRVLLDIRNNRGDFALHIAARKGNDTICKLLIMKGANSHVFNNVGDTPLHLACRNNHTNCAKALMHRDFLHNKNNCTGIVKFPQLIEMRINNHDGETCLQISVAKGNCELVHLMFLNGADVEEKRSTDGYKALHIAVNGKLYDMVKCLLEKCRANIHATTYGGKTACQLASGNEDNCMTELLLEFGAYEEPYSSEESSSASND